MTGNVTVTNISIDKHEMNVLNLVARYCYQPKKRCQPTPPYDMSLYSAKYDGCVDPRRQPAPATYNNNNSVGLWVSQYTISNSKNKFIVLGCDTSAYLSGYQNGELCKIGCSSQCYSLNNVVNGSCFGVGCCEVGFPDGLKNITVEVKSFQNHSEVWKFNPSDYAFVVEKGKFNFSASYLNNYTNQTVPLVLDWAVGNLKCKNAQKEPNYECKNNSECIDLQTRQDGYGCKCKQGYKGNPYLLHGLGGCQDIDECEDSTLNNCTKLRTIVIGNYTCHCPKWYRGDGRKDGEGCD